MGRELVEGWGVKKFEMTHANQGLLGYQLLGITSAR
jgi:hypothetical protein